MKKVKMIIPIFLLLNSVCAQATEGCLVPGYEDLLTYQGAPGQAYHNAGAIFPEPGCHWELVTFISGCVGHGKGGIKGEYALECPLDDYVICLAIFTSMLGVFYLKRK